ncbi:hypothetical protein [Enterobacter asburiae]|uniref:hypothetical protein n=1 Tax=Enterobacter cloacae complex TaxID=354276 RepID=UPI0035C68C18
MLYRFVAIVSCDDGPFWYRAKVDFSRPTQIWDCMAQRLAIERVEFAVADDAPLAGVGVQSRRPLFGLHDIAVGLGELLTRRSGHVIHRGAGHHSQVAPGCINHPVFTVKFWRACNAPDNLLYRFTLKEAGTHGVSDFIQPVGFKLLPPLFQQSPLEGLRHCCGVYLLGRYALQRHMLEDLLWNDAAEQVKLIPGLILNVARQFTCQRINYRLIGLLVQFTHTSQQRSQAASAVGIGTLTIQQHQQFGSQVSIHLAEQRHHLTSDASTVAVYIQAVRYRFVLQAVIDGAGHAIPRLTFWHPETMIQPAVRSEPHQDPHRHQ